MDTGADNNSSRPIMMAVPDLLAVLNAAWTLQCRLRKQFETGSLPARVGVPLFQLLDVFKSLDVTILDLTGREYSEGLAVEIGGVDSDSRTGGRLFIIEMIRPVVLLHDELIQTGKVVLGESGCSDKSVAGD